MATYTTTQKYLRVSPRKVRDTIAHIRSLTPKAALTQLQFMPTRASNVVAKVVKQALANATNNHNQNPDFLRFDSIQVNDGVTFKRWQPVSKGRAFSVFKRTSHIQITLKTITPTVTPLAPSTPPAASQTKPSAKAAKPAPAKATPATKKTTKKSPTSK